MCEAFPRSDYYGPSAPPQGHRLTTRQPDLPPLAGTADREPHGGSHVHCVPVGRGGAQLCPCGIATTTPQTFIVASEASDLNPHRSSQHKPIMLVRTAYQPESTGLELAGDLRSFSTGSSRTPSCLACRTRTIRQCWPVPALSGLLATLTVISRIRLPPASLCCCDSTTAKVFHLRPVTQRLVAHEVALPVAGLLLVLHLGRTFVDHRHVLHRGAASAAA